MSIYKKLFSLQQKIGAISKDSTNPFFKAKYFDINKLIEELKPVLGELKLVILQPLIEKDGKTLIRTIICDSEDDSILEGTAILPDNIDPQKMGSAITYYRRYSLQSMLFLQAEDDDGNHAKPTQNKIAQTHQLNNIVPLANPMMACESCGGNMKHIKGEKSQKTGKPFDFYSCEICKKNYYPK